MSISKLYNPNGIEDKWYSFWTDQEFFKSSFDPSKKAYSMIMPPPNITGRLHMGHVLNNSIQDILVRKARMEGKNCCWIPGLDHASIATEAKVLREKSLDKKKITRQEFLNYAWEWKDKYGAIILNQLKKLGVSCDWSRTQFTMDETYSDSVIKVFVDLYKKGLIYKGKRMINWDPEGLTAISDEEVIYKSQKGNLYYIDYEIKDISENITIATTRPETILADVAICVHPNDDRYRQFIGKKALVPIVNRLVPIISDDYVDPDFGTGCLKITPAHDPDDYRIAIKHNLDIIDIFTEDAKIAKNAIYYVGENRFGARKKIINDLQKCGCLKKTEIIDHKVGFSERTNSVVEPRLSTQWFLKMKKLVSATLKNDVNFYPKNLKKTYNHWIENIQDWCISRQLWWGHRIPAYYHKDGSIIVSESKEKAFLKFKKDNLNVSMEDIRQEEDVLDTWFSSWIFPLNAFNIIDKPDKSNNIESSYYYPANDLVTAPEILFFWVARMIIAGYEYTGKAPFKNVYFTGIVRDKKGKKMSKSLGNSPDTIDLIQKYGADSVRIATLFSSPAGNDLLFDESSCKQGFSFANKLWNAFRLIKLWKPTESIDYSGNKLIIQWFEAKMNYELSRIEDNYREYKISEALIRVYRLVWKGFCNIYLQSVKPHNSSNIDKFTYSKSIDFFEIMLKTLHPFMPFITEEIWQGLRKRQPNHSIMISSYPKHNSFDKIMIEEYEVFSSLVSIIRKDISEKNNKKLLRLKIRTSNIGFYRKIEALIKKTLNIDEVFSFGLLENIDTTKYHRISLLKEVKNEDCDEIFLLYASESANHKAKHSNMNTKNRITYYENYLKSIESKLNNEMFLKKAPSDVVKKEQKRRNDTIARINTLRKSLNTV